MNPRFKLACFFSLAFFSAIDFAGAACQAYRSDPAFLADLQKDDFYARVFHSVRKRSPEENEKLKALARERRPEHMGDLAVLEGYWRPATGAPFPFLVTERAPLHLKIRASSFPTAVPRKLEMDAAGKLTAVKKVEFDANGDGKPELVQEGESEEPLEYTYKREGDYQYIVRIYDHSGRVQTYKTRLRILSPTAFDAQLRTVWNDFKEALRRGDRAAAIECIHTRSRNDYRDNFAAIPDFRNKIDGTFGAIYPTEHRRGEVIYELLPKQGSDKFSYELRFEADFDAVWRIRSF